jgi:hypothetical protein
MPEDEQATGTTNGPARDGFELFAALRCAIVSIRTSLRGLAYGHSDAEQMLADTR